MSPVPLGTRLALAFRRCRDRVSRMYLAPDLASASREPTAIQFAVVPDIDALLSSSTPSMMWVYDPQTMAPNRPLLFPELADDEIIRNHAVAHSNPMGIGLALLPNVLLSGRSLVGTASSIYLFDSLVPPYVNEYIVKSWQPAGDLSLARKKERNVDGVSVSLTHWNSGVYGHWLLEGLPKLLLLRRLRYGLPEFRIVMPRHLNDYVANWVRLVLPDIAIDIYDDRSEYLRCSSLLVPTLLGSSGGHYFHPELRALLDELTPLQTGERSRFYVTRVEPSSYRKMSNQPEIESIALAHGLQIVKPETLPIVDQIALFSRAELMVGEFGSAMHNALFGPSTTTVFCLNWINVCQSRIAQLKGQRVGYLLPRAGPVKHAYGAASQTYRIDPAAFDTCLTALSTGLNPHP